MDRLLVLVRHGQSEWNLKNLFTGWRDVDLTPAGIEALRFPATHIETTLWRVEGVRLPLPGRWQAQVDILVSDFEKITIEDEIELPR